MMLDTLDGIQEKKLQARQLFLLFSKIETELDKQVFYYRSEYFFSQSILNSLLLMTWSMMLAALIYLAGLDGAMVVTWLVVQLLLCYSIMFFYEKNPKEKSISELKKMLVARLVSGVLISISFSILLFITKDKAEIGYYIILLGGVAGTFFIMIMSQLYFPDYYYAYGLVYYVTTAVAVFMSTDDLSAYAAVVAIMGGFYALIKGTYFSVVMVSHVYIKRQLINDKEVLSTLKENLQHALLHDDLTHLPNRRYLYDFFKRLTLEDKNDFLLIYIDLDNFKAINDDLGHEVGDWVLKSVSNTISKNIRKTDKAFRIGGDEFCIIIADIEEHDEFERIINGIQGVLTTTINHQQEVIKVSASIGYAHYPSDGTTLKAVLSVADKKMYTEKKQKGPLPPIAQR